jgi:hypothetical protein
MDARWLDLRLSARRGRRAALGAVDWGWRVSETKTDIVERLRGGATKDYRCQCLQCEAADEIERLRAELAAAIKQRDEAHGLIRKWRLNLVDVVEVGDYMDAMTSEAHIGMNDADKRAFLSATRKEGGGA